LIEQPTGSVRGRAGRWPSSTASSASRSHAAAGPDRRSRRRAPRGRPRARRRRPRRRPGSSARRTRRRPPASRRAGTAPASRRPGGRAPASPRRSPGVADGVVGVDGQHAHVTTS
jgi:hypothetical protein